jgi:hypothetical protein
VPFIFSVSRSSSSPDNTAPMHQYKSTIHLWHYLLRHLQQKQTQSQYQEQDCLHLVHTVEHPLAERSFQRNSLGFSRVWRPMAAMTALVLHFVL